MWGLEPSALSLELDRPCGPNRSPSLSPVGSSLLGREPCAESISRLGIESSGSQWLRSRLWVVPLSQRGMSAPADRGILMGLQHSCGNICVYGKSNFSENPLHPRGKGSLHSQSPNGSLQHGYQRLTMICASLALLQIMFAAVTAVRCAPLTRSPSPIDGGGIALVVSPLTYKPKSAIL